MEKGKEKKTKNKKKKRKKRNVKNCFFFVFFCFFFSSFFFLLFLSNLFFQGEQSEHDRIIRASKALFGRLLDRYYRKWQTFVWTQRRRHGQLGKAMAFAAASGSKKWFLVWHNNVCMKN